MEERQRAIAAAQQQTQAGSSRSRQPSPGPSTRVPLPDGAGHRRDRSRGPETRFPISTASVQSPTAKGVMSPTSTTSSHRDSLGVPQSPPQPRMQPAPAPPSPPPKDVPRTNGSIHQPPPAEEETPEATPPTNRERSATEASKRQSVAPTLSASITGPQDFMSPSHYYSSSIDSSNPTPTTSTAPTSVAESTKGPQVPSKYKINNPDSEDNSPATDGNEAPAKRDSLNRRAYPARKGTGGLQRQSLVMGGNRDSDSGSYTQSPIDAQNAESSPAAGVQLQDKPMDFD